jgi:hypothetical protein
MAEEAPDYVLDDDLDADIPPLGESYDPDFNAPVASVDVTGGTAESGGVVFDYKSVIESVTKTIPDIIKASQGNGSDGSSSTTNTPTSKPSQPSQPTTPVVVNVTPTVPASSSGALLAGGAVLAVLVGAVMLSRRSKGGAR